MIKQVKRAALYVRVSTDHQTLENQIHELTQIAERRGWQVVEICRQDHHLQAGVCGLLRGEAAKPIERQARQTMAGNDGDLRLSGYRRSPCG
jgi:hypothetical protein